MDKQWRTKSMKQNGHSEGDPVIRAFKFFKNDGAESKWIAYCKDADGKITKSLAIEADRATLLSYGLKEE